MICCCDVVSLGVVVAILVAMGSLRLDAKEQLVNKTQIAVRRFAISMSINYRFTPCRRALKEDDLHAHPHTHEGLEALKNWRIRRMEASHLCSDEFEASYLTA